MRRAYSAGCVLYELLTGRTSFVGSSQVELTFQHVHHAPEPPSKFREHVDPRLDYMVLRALAKARAARNQSAEQFRLALLTARPGQNSSGVAFGAA